MISNQIDFFIPLSGQSLAAFYADCCQPRPAPRRGRFYGQLLVFTFPNIHIAYIHTYIFGFFPQRGFIFIFFFGLAVAIEFGSIGGGQFSISLVGAFLLFAWLWLSFDLYGMFAYFSFDLLLRSEWKVPAPLLYGNFS